MTTYLASESWIDGWPLWLRLLALLVAAPMLIAGALLVINGIAGDPDQQGQ